MDKEQIGSSANCHGISEMVNWIGGRWSILILRDALNGITRFDQFQKSLGITSSILSQRLSRLVEAGVLQKRPYCERPRREEYVLTELGMDFKPVLQALSTWGSQYVHAKGGANSSACIAKA